MIVYRAKNKVNGKIYIGQTQKESPVKRLRCHVLSSFHFGRALRKYGLHNFEVTVVARAETQDELNRKERSWIKRANSKVPNGYNLTDGGEGGYLHHPSTCKKMSRFMKKYCKNPEVRRRLAANAAKQERGPEFCRKISEGVKQHYRDHPEAVQELVRRATGKSPSKKTRKKLSLALVGKNVGRKRPDLTARNKVASQNPRYVNPMKGRKRPDLAARNRAGVGRKMSLVTRRKMVISHDRRKRERIALGLPIRNYKGQ